MDDIEARKKEILKRLNANIKALKAFGSSELYSKGPNSTKRSLSEKTDQSIITGAKSGEQYIKEMRIRISQESQIPKSLRKSQFQVVKDEDVSSSVSGSQNSISSDHRIKFDGKVRDFLAHKRSVDSSIAYKKPWIGGSDHNKSSKTDQERLSLSSPNKPMKIMQESKPAPARLVSILKSQPRPISRRSNITSATSETSETTQKSATSASSSERSSRTSYVTESSKRSKSVTESRKSSRPTTSKSADKKPFGWNIFSKKTVNPTTTTRSVSTASKTVSEMPIKNVPAAIQSIPPPAKEKSIELRSKRDNKDSSDISRCQYCSRPFNSDRLEKHESICQKMTKNAATRGTFDSSKKRVEGTEIRSKSAPSKGSRSKKAVTPDKLKSNWRKNHEEFIKSLRQAKAISAHIANGGKPSDFPVSISKNDGTPCPHCSRKFGEASFERHVQICANLKHFGPRKSK